MAGDLIPPHTYESGDLLTASSLNDFLLEAKIKDEVVKFSHFTKEALEQLEDFFNKRRYKVGDIIVTKSTENPSAKFGGQWELLKDRFLLGAGGEYSLASTGGEKEHTLTINEMPSHNHTMINLVKGAMAISNHPSFSSLGTSETDPNDTTDHKSNRNMARNGNDKPHNNMPPYIAVYIWEKISDEDDSSVL